MQCAYDENAALSSNRSEWNDSRIIKIFSANGFVWLQVDGAGRRNFIIGYYDRDTYYGMTIREVPRETSFKGIEGKLQEYEINVDGNVLTTEGQRSTGIHVKEEFRRLDLSSGMDVLINL